MTDNKPEKPSQEWLDHLKKNYTYDREKGQVLNNKMGKPALGPNSRGYLIVKTTLKRKRKYLSTHHVVWFFEYDEWATSCLDHIDGDKTNNHHTNLRQVTHRENVQFYQKSRKTSSKYLGVVWAKERKKWRSALHFEGRGRFLGYFTCELEAARAYDRALVSINLDPLNVKILRNEERLQKVMEFIND